MNQKKALIAMSGGVDSSVAAKLMQQEGYACIGCTMVLFDPGRDESGGQSDGGQSGGGQSDGEGGDRDARRVAESLGMPFYAFDFQADFRRCVIDPFTSEYAEGRTPNPCIECNRTLKFGALMEESSKLGCDCLATGHYARVEKDPLTGKYLLRKALDESKDQSYVLYNLTQQQLAHIQFPLGSLSKSQVRQLAGDSGFVNADKPESQDICFVPDGDYASMIRRYTGRDFPPGDFVDLDGNVMGTHKGIIHYTIGQTRRLGQAFGRPRYVVRIDGAANRIVLGGPDDVYSTHAKAGRFNWISGEIPRDEVRCRVRTRYKQKEQWATVRPLPGEHRSGAQKNGGSGEHAVEILFDEPQRAITPGQAAVLYDGDIVLGGGTILED